MAVELGVAPSHIRVPMLVIANPHDPVVDYSAVRSFCRKVGGPPVEFEEIADSEMPHNIVGRITSPSTVERVIERILRFVRPKVPRPPEGERRRERSPRRERHSSPVAKRERTPPSRGSAARRWLPR